MTDNYGTSADATCTYSAAAENGGGEPREESVADLIEPLSRESAFITPNHPSFPESSEHGERGSGASGKVTEISSAGDSEKPLLHRTSSLPDSPASIMFYRNKESTKSSRSIRFDLRHDSGLSGDDGGSVDDEDASPVGPTTPASALCRLESHHRTNSAPVLPSPLYRYAEEQKTSQADFGMAPVGEDQPLLLAGRRPSGDVEQPTSAVPPASKKPSGGILRRGDGFHRAQRMAEERRLTRIAAAFFTDYITSQAPTLPPDSDYVTEWHLFLHSLRFSNAWKIVMSVATVCLFLASCYEGGDGDDNWQTYDEVLLKARIRHRERALLILTFVPVLVYAADMIMLNILMGRKYKRIKRATGQLQTLRFAHGVLPRGVGGNAQAFLSEDSSPVSSKARKSRAWLWAFPLITFLISLSIETLIVVMTHTIMERRIWTSAFKPIVFFYASSKSRNALDAMNRVARIVFRVIFIELFLILSFAAVACQLYGEQFQSFDDLPRSFLSMFMLSTTVVNPSLWMGVYAERPPSAIFFILFLVVSVFYLHSLVLSVVFQSYMDGMRIIREHAEIDREKNLELAFETLYRIKRDDDEDGASRPIFVSSKYVQKVLMLMRPHYRSLKIQTLMNIVDPGQSGSLDYNTFRLKVPKALNTSVRSKRRHNSLSRFLEVLAAFVAVANLVYVVLVSSSFHSTGWEVATGFVITSLGIIELLIRLIPVKMYRIAEAVKPSFVFDGFAICAAVVSLVALTRHGFDYKRSLDYLFTGRAIDMLRCLRLNKDARGIVKRSSEVLPALVGPLALLVTSTHMFTYLGMSFWGGEVIVHNNPALTPNYDLNNFNNYTSGLITMFQVLVVNDWHAIAEVFILPYHMSNLLVYPFFVVANLINVSILLNVMIAFFVGAFVTKALGKDTVIGMDHKMRTNAASLRNVVLSYGMNHVKFEGEESSDDESSESVTVTERQGFDNIMRTVAGEDDDEDEAAKLCSDVLELFESLSPVKEKVGYLVSCQQSKSRYGNKRFLKLVHQIMDNRTMHSVVSEMHSELSTLPDGHKRAVHRKFPPLPGKTTNASLELIASLLDEGSSISLFVARSIPTGDCS